FTHPIAGGGGALAGEQIGGGETRAEREERAEHPVAPVLVLLVVQVLVEILELLDGRFPLLLALAAQFLGALADRPARGPAPLLELLELFAQVLAERRDALAQDPAGVGPGPRRCPQPYANAENGSEEQRADVPPPALGVGLRPGLHRIGLPAVLFAHAASNRRRGGRRVSLVGSGPDVVRYGNVSHTNQSGGGAKHLAFHKRLTKNALGGGQAGSPAGGRSDGHGGQVRSVARHLSYCKAINCGGVSWLGDSWARARPAQQHGSGISEGRRVSHSPLATRRF